MRAIDADVLKQHIDKLPALPDGNFAGNHSALKALINMQPTIEPSTNNSEIPNSSDTISRKAATDAIEKCHKQCCREDATGDEWIHYETTLNEVESIPPAPKNDADCISRQAAIDAIGEKADEIYKTKQKGATYPHNDFFQGMAYAEDVVKRLPSAQPETTRRIVGKSKGGMTLWYECERCGEPVDEGDKFCRGCGAKMEVTNAELD